MPIQKISPYLQCSIHTRGGIPLLFPGQRLFYAPFPTYHIGTAPPRGRLMAPLLRVSVEQRDRPYLLSLYGRTNKLSVMLYTETICPQANNSTLPSTPAGAKSDYSARSNNLVHSMDDPAARAFIRFLEITFPDIRKIRFRRRGGTRCRYYVLWARTATATFSVKGYSVSGTAFNLLHILKQSKQ